MTRSHTPRWRRARGLAALAVPLALAAGVLPASGTALAQPATPASNPTPATTTAGTAEPTGPTRATGSVDQHQAQPLSLPALHDDSYSVTLLTGDQVRLTAAGAGRYTVVATPATVHATVTVNATGGPAGVKTLQAVPSAAQFLLAAGLVDTGLFDIQYLAAHGYTDGANKPIPVTVQYADHPTADTMTRRAGSLPASTLAATDNRTGTADLRVDPHHATDFWAALTNGGAAGLADGIAQVWLTGHRASDGQAARPHAGEPTYPVTVTLTLRPDDLGGVQIPFCNGALSTICAATANLGAVAGDNAGTGYTAVLTCVDQDPCTTMRARFDVPAGSYIAEPASTHFSIDAHDQFAWVLAPQVEVNGPTDVALDLSRLKHVDITTPKPSKTYEGTVQWQRTLPDGRYFNALSFGFYGTHSIWTLPTGQPVTVGAFHFSTAWVLGTPTLTARVDGPKGFDLHPMYSFYNTGNDSVVRFNGRQRLQVVDAGYGHPEDFAGIDARGKLAIIRVGDADTGWCTRSSFGKMSKAQLDNAIKAGAAGVLVDPRTPNKVPDGWCALPISYQPATDDPNGTRPDIPFAALGPDEAIRLEGLLGHGAVRVTITDGGVSPYTYNLKFYEEGAIPGSLHYDVDNDQLTAVDVRYHADALTGLASQTTGVFRPNEDVAGGVPNALAWPARRTEYYGPVAPDLVYDRFWEEPDEVPGAGIVRRIDMFDQRGGSRTEDLNARPASPGPFAYDPRVPAAQPPPDRFAQSCAMCRQGNALSTIVNLHAPISGAAALNPATTHLYLGDQEIPMTSVPPGLPAYVLPPEKHTYRLVTDYDNAGFGHTHADWTFTSAAPDHNQTPPGTLCFGNPDDPCRADPIVFLTYDLGVALDNTLTAPSVGQFTVTASHQAADAPEIRDLKVWTSTDDGQHWKPALVLPRGHGEHGARDFSVLTGVPPVSQTTGALSIKAQATDAAGNSITETLTQAVKLTQDSGWGWPGHLTWQ